MQKKLTEFTNDILSYIQEIPLSDNTVRYYRSCYNSLIKYCNSKNENTKQLIEDFVVYWEKRYKQGQIGKIYFLIMRKAIYVLIEYMESNIINWKRKNYNPKKLCKNFTNILEQYKNTLLNSDLSEGSIKLLTQMVVRFLIFLEKKNICEINKVQLCHVKDFVVQEAPKQKASIINLTWPMKKFFSFLTLEGCSNINVNNILANPMPNKKKVLPCFSEDEINSILKSVNTSTAIGKRDYAIIKIAIGIGIRAVDITNLCFSNIDWRKKEITIIQQKTKCQLTLPLPIDVGNAIADYILNGRPKSESPYIFLKSRRPYEKLNRIVGANTIQRCLNKTEIVHVAGDGKSFHAFRRTFGTNLVKVKTPISTISQLLGHNSIDTAKRYINLNDEMLKNCCMDISIYATVKEGLI